MKYHDKFGFLNIKESFDFDGGKIDTVEEFDTSREWIYKYENSDGFIYPPQERQIKINSIASNEIEDIPHTTRPALIHKLPNSHSIHLVSACNKDLSRNNHSGFIVHLLSYLYGTRLQFDGWWFDGRVPIKPTHNFSVRKCVTEDFLSKSYSTYKEWSAEHRAWFLNILIMHSRAPLYEWDWERFSMEYMV
ncbi:MAG: hypothetical protein OEZ16_13450, partial [Chromatiales bacterium]|nr:hypothetical protein [Chromatiales bacterium]